MVPYCWWNFKLMYLLLYTCSHRFHKCFLQRMSRRALSLGKSYKNLSVWCGIVSAFWQVEFLHDLLTWFFSFANVIMTEENWICNFTVCINNCVGSFLTGHCRCVKQVFLDKILSWRSAAGSHLGTDKWDCTWNLTLQTAMRCHVCAPSQSMIQPQEDSEHSLFFRLNCACTTLSLSPHSECFLFPVSDSSQSICTFTFNITGSETMATWSLRVISHDICLV